MKQTRFEMDGTSEPKSVTCTLTPAAQKAETRKVRAEVAPHIIDRELLENGTRLTFRNSPVLRKSVERLVELDKGCCTFLEHRIEDSGRFLTLDVTSVSSGIPFAKEFLAAPTTTSERRWRLGLKAGALLGACGLACAAPLLLSSVGLGILGAGAGSMMVEIATLGVIVMAAGGYWYYKRKKSLSVEGVSNENRCGG